MLVYSKNCVGKFFRRALFVMPESLLLFWQCLVLVGYVAGYKRLHLAHGRIATGSEVYYTRSWSRIITTAMGWLKRSPNDSSCTEAGLTTPVMGWLKPCTKKSSYRDAGNANPMMC